jgi:F-type H+-transporting ATPase subunit c
MDAESLKLIVKGVTIAIGGIFPAMALGKIVSKAMESIGRNPEAGSKLFVPMLLGAAFAEAIAIYSLVVVFTLK